MSLLRVTLLVLVVIAASLALVDGKNPSRECRICEDVAQTYHDRYQCAGRAVDMWGAGDNPLIHSCEEPLFSCQKMTGDIAQACVSLEQQLYDDEEHARILWTSQMEFGNHYDTCVKLGKCDEDYNAEEKDYTPCHQVFDSPAGKYDILEPAFTTNCTEECYLCNWLVREWPLFQEICVPDGTQMANSIDPDRSAMKEAALEGLGRLGKAKATQEKEDAVTEAQEETETTEETEPETEAEEPAANDASFMQQPNADELLMRSTHSNWEGQVPYEQGLHPWAQQQQGDVDEGVFLETGTKLRGMQRAWSRHTTRAIQGVLQSQASESRAPAKTGKNVDLLFSHISAEEDHDTEAGPALTGTDLKEDCFTMWRYFARSRKAKFFTSWKTTIGIEITPADIERSNNWDANIACKCLGQCGLDPFEHLGLIKQCRYDEKDRTMMEYAFGTPH